MNIDERIAELMQGPYDPMDVDNMAEALANLEPSQAATMSVLFRVAKYHLVGAYIESVVREHWYKLAKTQAECDEGRERQSSCERCHGAGCSSCDEDARRERRDYND